LLGDYFRLGISGDFFNTLEKSNNLVKKTYYDDNGAKYAYKEDIIDDSFNWNNIKNNLNVFLGWRYLEYLHFNFAFGGGTEIDNYSEIKKQQNLIFNQDSTLIIADGKKMEILLQATQQMVTEN
ncbi:MAG TPA: hypothetical protein PK771_07610, partial [Spirochaetota bacterium]|nr:hypothetical protein [Spirochaetota bacterium]